MKVFIDFDDVIFNTKKFKKDLMFFFERHGVNQEIFQKHYYDPNDGNLVKLFDPEGLFSRLERYEKMDVSSLRENFAQHMKKLNGFVFDDVEVFLRSMGKENVYLISFGLPVFQNEKIIGTGINKMVNGCVVTKGSKAEAIAQVMEKMKIDPSEKIIFIDDRGEQIRDIKKVFPEVRTFLLCRKDGRYCDERNEYCDYEVRSLKEVQEILTS